MLVKTDSYQTVMVCCCYVNTEYLSAMSIKWEQKSHVLQGYWKRISVLIQLPSHVCKGALESNARCCGVCGICEPDAACVAVCVASKTCLCFVVHVVKH